MTTETDDTIANDPLYQDAVNAVKTQQFVSTSFLQRHLKIGYHRAARLLEAMEEECLVSDILPTGYRQVT